MKAEERISQYWESVEETSDASNDLKIVEQRMEKVGEDDFADRANKLRRKINELHRDIDAQMEKEAEMTGITQ